MGLLLYREIIERDYNAALNILDEGLRIKY